MAKKLMVFAFLELENQTSYVVVSSSKLGAIRALAKKRFIDVNPYDYEPGEKPTLTALVEEQFEIVEIDTSKCGVTDLTDYNGNF